MKLSRRLFLRAASGAAAALALPTDVRRPPPARRTTAPDPTTICGPSPASGPAGRRPAVRVVLGRHPPRDEALADGVAVEGDVGSVDPGRLFRVESPQAGYRLLVWDPRENRHVFIGSEAVGPVESPFWSAFADDGKWLDVTLTTPQHIKAMQGDDMKMQDLVTAGLQGTTKPGFYRILRRVYNETMDSRTDPGLDGHVPAEGRDVHPVLHG